MMLFLALHDVTEQYHVDGLTVFAGEGGSGVMVEMMAYE